MSHLCYSDGRSDLSLHLAELEGDFLVDRRPADQSEREHRHHLADRQADIRHLRVDRRISSITSRHLFIYISWTFRGQTEKATKLGRSILLILLEAAIGIEPMNKGFAVR